MTATIWVPTDHVITKRMWRTLDNLYGEVNMYDQILNRCLVLRDRKSLRDHTLERAKRDMNEAFRNTVSAIFKYGTPRTGERFFEWLDDKKRRYGKDGLRAALSAHHHKYDEVPWNDETVWFQL